MWSTVRKDGWRPPAEAPGEEAAKRRGRDLSGKYQLLFDYLEHRYADTVVLMLAQIEDLIGFTLPDQAHTDPDWWTAAGTGTTEPCYSNAWTLAQRTATPHLKARHVVFERSSSEPCGL